MPNTDTKVSQLVINELTKEQFDRAVEAGQISDTELYLVEDEGGTTGASFPLLSTMWSDHILNDVSWLRADTFSWQSGDVYKSVYEKLVAEYATGTEETEEAITFKRTESGFKIAEATQEQAILDLYNSTGVAWYYILDTTNKRFKLPRTKYNFVGLRDSVGSYVEESLPNITGNIVGVNMSVTSQDWNGALSSTYGGNASRGSGSSPASTLNFDASRSSSTYKDNAPVQQRATQMYLYFFVGNYTQTAIQQTAGLNAELFNGKLDIDSPIAQSPYITEQYDDGNGNGYKVWSNKFCEQWGEFQSNDSTDNTINFLKEFRDTKYKPIVGMMGGNSGSPAYWVFSIYAKNETNMVIHNATNGTSNICYWTAIGYIL